jgi:hypothetical protein
MQWVGFESRASHLRAVLALALADYPLGQEPKDKDFRASQGDPASRRKAWGHHAK